MVEQKFRQRDRDGGQRNDRGKRLTVDFELPGLSA
jgi:hypothetical protein